jgi:hypothetical protein
MLHMLLALQALGWACCTTRPSHEPSGPSTHFRKLKELFQPSLFQIDKEEYVWILSGVYLNMIEDTKTLYKGAVFLFAEEAGNAAIAEAAKSLAEQEITTREDIENYMGVSRSSRKSREGGERPTTLMSLEKWKTSIAPS